MRVFASLIAVFCLISTGCSSGGSERKSVTYTTGDKATVDKLTYSVVDTQILPRLGDEASPRLPQHRFYVVDLAVSNSGSSEAAIPGMTLVDDAGKNYDELPDGMGVARWLGAMRRVQGNQTEQGAVVFDAPAGHYKLKLTDDTDSSDVYVDIPLSFAHEQLQNETQTGAEAAVPAAPPEPLKVSPPAKKK